MKNLFNPNDAAYLITILGMAGVYAIKCFTDKRYSANVNVNEKAVITFSPGQEFDMSDECTNDIEEEEVEE